MLYLEISGTFTVVFGLTGTQACLIAATQTRNSHSIGYSIINLPSLDILDFVIAHKSKPGFSRVTTIIWFQFGGTLKV